MPDAHANFAYGTVLTPPSPATSGTSLALNSGQGAQFPTPPFNATVWPASSPSLSSNAEIIRVTGVAGDVFTFTRAQESTSARSIVAGDQIAATVTKKTLTDIESNIPSGTPTPGDSPKYDGSGLSYQTDLWLLKWPSGTKAANSPDPAIFTGGLTPVSGTVYMVLLPIEKGRVVSNINFRVGGTALSGGTHQYAGIADKNAVLLAASADQALASKSGSTDWAFPIATVAAGSASSWTCPATDAYFTVFCSVHTGLSLYGMSTGTQAFTPNISQTGGTGQTGIPPAIGTTYSSLTVTQQNARVWLT